MSEQTVEKQEASAEPSAETKNAENQYMIPKSRFDEINEENKKLQARLDALETESQKRLETQLAEQGKYKELAEERAQKLAEAQAKADQLEATQAVLSNYLKSQIEEIPEDNRSLIPDTLPVEQQLDWIARNRSKLIKPAAPNIGAGQRGGSGEQTVNLTAEEMEISKRFKMSPEEYAKFK